jgi:hypothetical protein
VEDVHVIEYQTNGSVEIDKLERPAVRLATFDGVQKATSLGVLNLVVDTGAYITVINKITAENGNYPIVAENALMLYGFFGKGIIKREVVKKGKDVDSTVGNDFRLNPLQAKTILERNGLHNVGLLCDLRVIPAVAFCGFMLEDVVIATPVADDADITEVLGMNVLGYFQFGIDLDRKKIYLRKGDGGYEPSDSRFRCGKIT